MLDDPLLSHGLERVMVLAVVSTLTSVPKVRCSPMPPKPKPPPSCPSPPESPPPLDPVLAVTLRTVVLSSADS